VGIPCFFIEPTDRIRRALRRFRSPTTGKCPLPRGYCNAVVPLDEIESTTETLNDTWPHDDPRWPTRCECGYAFSDKDEWQLFTARLYRRVDNGEVMTLREAPPGAMWYADGMIHGDPPRYCGPDGHCLAVVTPRNTDGTGRHEWIVDSRCSNCDMLDDHEHKCWVRHGTPPNITVDKNGRTCGAGAGSILVHDGGWHGFLRNGELVVC